MKKFTDEELLTVLRFTETLADVTTGRVPESGTRNRASFGDAKTTDEDLKEAERQARAYAEAKNKGKRFHSDYGASEAERGLTASVKNWLERRRKRGHKV